MLNSIALSSDQQFLFLIDNGDAIAFPLDEENGVLIGLLGEQLTASSAPDATPSQAVQLPFTLNTTEAQWQLMFTPETNVLHIIGKIKVEEPGGEKARNIGSTDVDPGRNIGSTDVDPGRNIGSTDVDPGRATVDATRRNIKINLNTQVVHLILDGGEIRVSLINK